jgi:hypothetical protein
MATRARRLLRAFERWLFRSRDWLTVAVALLTWLLGLIVTLTLLPGNLPGAAAVTFAAFGVIIAIVGVGSSRKRAESADRQSSEAAKLMREQLRELRMIRSRLDRLVDRGS